MINSIYPEELFWPDLYLKPKIRMSPYDGRLNHINPKIIKKASILSLCKQFVSPNYDNFSILKNGRHAINTALNSIGLDKSCSVSILTPSKSNYVSKCVTDEISKFCNFKINDKNADAYFLIHEFGRRIIPSKEIVLSNKPIIEDCAYLLSSSNLEHGYFGDYLVFSCSKAFNTPHGGLLFSKGKIHNKNNISKNYLSIIQSGLYENLKNLNKISIKRKSVFHQMQIKCREYGLTHFYKVTENDFPTAFLIDLDNEITSEKLELIKQHMNEMGVESSVFYGNNCYFIPCHQNVGTFEIEYMFYHLRYILNNL